MLGLTAAGTAGLLAACGGGGASDSSSGVATGAQPPAVRQATPTGEAPKYGGQLSLGISDEPGLGFDAHTGYGGTDHQFLYMVSDPLIGYDQKGQVDPALSLAEKWETPDPQRVVLKLRSGVTFHDGSPFTAEDVKWNIERIIDPATQATPRSDLAAIEGVQIVSPNEVVLRLKEPSAPLLTNFGDRGGMIVPRAAFEKLGKDTFVRKPVGTGAFMLKEWVSDAHMVLERNPRYWRTDARAGKLPYLQTLRLEFIPEATVRTAALESGQIDLLAGTPATDVKRLNENKSLQSTSFIGASTGKWNINHAFAPLDNVNFRRALSWAMDRENYVKNFLTGTEPLATGLLTPASWANDPSIPRYGYDLNKVKEFLQASGLPPSAWRIKTQPAAASISEAEQFWEAGIKAAGITLDWNAPERNGPVNRLMKGQGADGTAAMSVTAWSMRVDPDGNVGPAYTEKGAFNPGQAPVPETEALIVKARQTYDPQERKKLYGEIQRKAVEQVYSLILLHYNVARSHANKRVGNLDALYGGEGKPRYGNMWVSG